MIYELDYSNRQFICYHNLYALKYLYIVICFRVFQLMVYEIFFFCHNVKNFTSFKGLKNVFLSSFFRIMQIQFSLIWII